MPSSSTPRRTPGPGCSDRLSLDGGTAQAQVTGGEEACPSGGAAGPRWWLWGQADAGLLRALGIL